MYFMKAANISDFVTTNKLYDKQKTRAHVEISGSTQLGHGPCDSVSRSSAPMLGIGSFGTLKRKAQYGIFSPVDDS